MQVLEASFARIRGELEQCKNQTGILSEEFKALTEAILDKEHLMPRTLKGTSLNIQSLNISFIISVRLLVIKLILFQSKYS